MHLQPRSKLLIHFILPFFLISILFSMKLEGDQGQQLENFSPELLQERAVKEFYQGKIKNAFNSYKLLIVGYLKQGNHQKALHYLPDLLTLASKIEVDHEQVILIAEKLIGPYYTKIDNFGEKDPYSKNRIDREDESIYNALKAYGIYLVAREDSRSITIFNTLLTEYPTARDDWQVYFYLVLGLESKAETERATPQLTSKLKSALTRVMELNPYLSISYRKMAELYRNEGKLDLAIDMLSKALSSDRSQVEIYRNLGELYQELGDYSRAYSFLKRIAAYYKPGDLGISQKIAQIESIRPEFLKTEDKKPSPRTQFKTELQQFIRYSKLKDSPIIRVGLTSKARTIVFKSLTPFIITNLHGEILFEQGLPREVWTLEKKGDNLQITNGIINKVFRSADKLRIIGDGDPSFLIFNLPQGEGYFWGRKEDSQFRGNLEVLNKPDGLTLVNLVHLEEYLLSVVPGEMPALWPLEALKAQAVAARSYTLANLNKHREEGFDLCSGVHCAAYRGISWEHPRSSRAVLATVGEVMEYEGKVIDAVFNSNSGGYTEDSEDVWQTRVNYLRGTSTLKEDNLQFPLEPFSLTQWFKNRPVSYSETVNVTAPANYRWVRYFTAEEIEARLDLGPVIAIIPLERSEGGSIKKIKVIGEKGSRIIDKGYIRSTFLGLRSNKFIVEGIGEPGKPKKAFIFFGGGWGHGVGLDQTAAAGMAEDGYNYRDILQRFYRGIKIKSMMK